MKPEKPNYLIGLDNFQRSADSEQQLNTLFTSCFITENGKKILEYLRSITIESVAGSEVSDSSLRHLEGQRYLVGLIQRRVNKGKSQRIIKEKKDVR